MVIWTQWVWHTDFGFPPNDCLLIFCLRKTEQQKPIHSHSFIHLFTCSTKFLSACSISSTCSERKRHFNRVMDAHQILIPSSGLEAKLHCPSPVYLGKAVWPVLMSGMWAWVEFHSWPYAMKNLESLSLFPSLDHLGPLLNHCEPLLKLRMQPDGRRPGFWLTPPTTH